MENQAYLHWLSEALDDEKILQELHDMKDDPEAISECFFQRLAFGTGGLRGKLGAGTNRMNLYMVCWAATGLAEYLMEQGGSKQVVIAYDCRHRSKEFAEAAASTLEKYQIKALIFDRLMPTPMLSYAVRRLSCQAGIVITASHNPADYNGFKVYGLDGGQITEAAASAISRYLVAIDPLKTLARTEEANKTQYIEIIPEWVEEEYYHEVLNERLSPPGENLSIVYSPLYGTGQIPTHHILNRAGYANVAFVPTQKSPNGDFPTCPIPNPELPEAFSEALKVGKACGADLLLATDPDCDRIGVMVCHQGAYRSLSGNEIGLLLFDYICRNRQANGSMPSHPAAVKTIVTSELAGRIAEKYQVELIDVLTGFKYIGEIIGKLEQAGAKQRFIFGFEESCGYLSGTYVRDKDAVNACLLICDMASEYQHQGLTLFDGMQALYLEHGFTVSRLLSKELAGEAGKYAIQRTMQYLRSEPITHFIGKRVLQKKDYLTPAQEKTISDMPPADVIKFTLEDQTTLIFRPSGTEPKLKIYISVTQWDATADEKIEKICRSVLAETEKLLGKAANER